VFLAYYPFEKILVNYWAATHLGFPFPKYDINAGCKLENEIQKL